MKELTKEEHRAIKSLATAPYEKSLCRYVSFKGECSSDKAIAAAEKEQKARNDTQIELHLIDAHNLLGGIASDLESVGFSYMARRVADVNLRVYKILHCDIPEMLEAEKEQGE